MIRQRDQEKEVELKKLSEVIFILILKPPPHKHTFSSSSPDEQEEAVGGHGGGGEQERQQAGRVAEAERERAPDPQLKVIFGSDTGIRTTFQKHYFLHPFFCIEILS